MSIRTLALGLIFMYAAFLPARAHAQFAATPFSDPATGERYHIEAAGAFWNPDPHFLIASESLPGILGTTIDAVADLGVTRHHINEFRLVLRPGRKHKFRLDYLPLSYNATSVLRRAITFNGIRYDINLPVQTQMSWKTWHIGYEYDFLYRDRWFVGLVLQAKATDIQATIQAPIGTEFARAQAPIPSLGGIARVYVVPNISITGELVGIKVPNSIDERYRLHYFDFDIYGTVNFTNYVGAQIGYRSLDLSYLIEGDLGDFKAKGLYFGGVVRY
jgi:hypothetical protein